MDTLIHTLKRISPFIQQYQGQTIVVKYGGNAMINAELKKAVMADILQLHQLGINIVLVHGGGPEISQGLKLLGKESQFINGLRVTDQDTIDVALQMLAGKVNKSLVAQLQGKGIGLSGIDAGLLQCEKLTGSGDLGFVGEIINVNPQVLEMALASGLIPVISTLGVDAQGVIYNINADTAASQIAIALQATKLVSMTDISGLLRDRHDESTLISHANLAEVDQLIAQGVIVGGMIPKIACCTDFIKAGGQQAVILDGRVPHAILIEMLSDQANGTRFSQK